MDNNRSGRLRRLMSSLRFRISSAFILLLGVALVIINYYPVRLMREQVIAAKESEMTAAAVTLASALEGFSALTEENVFNAVRLLEVMRDRRVLVTDDGGVVIYDSLQIGRAHV